MCFDKRGKWYMNYEEKIYLKVYLRVYLFFVVVLVLSAIIGIKFLNQDTFGFLWTFTFMSIGLFIIFLVKIISIRKKNDNNK